MSLCLIGTVSPGGLRCSSAHPGDRGVLRSASSQLGPPGGIELQGQYTDYSKDEKGAAHAVPCGMALRFPLTCAPQVLFLGYERGIC